MKTNTIITIIIGIVIIGGGIWVFNNDSLNNNDSQKVEQVKSSSVLTSDKEIFDFGDIDIFSGTVQTDFVLKNNGPDDIVITEGITSCGCTNGEIGGITFGMHTRMNSELTIPAGETKNLTVIYDPLAHGPSGVGLAQRSVSLKTNSIETPVLEVRIKARVINNN